MKSPVLLFIALFLLVCHGVEGQSYAFRVLASKGDNFIQRSGSYQSYDLEAGLKLKEGDKLITSANSYVGLVHRNGKTLEVQERGTFTISTLESRIGNREGGIAGQYMNLVIDRVEGNGTVVERDAPAVVRGARAAEIKMLIKETKNANLVLGDQVTVNWVERKDLSPYVVRVKNIFDEELMVIETTQPKIRLDFTQNRLARERFIIVGVSSKADEDLRSRDYGIQRLTPLQGRRLMYQLADLKRQFGNESSLNKLVYASFYEANGLYLEALDQYQEAMSISPDVTDFQAMYENFVLTNGLGN